METEQQQLQETPDASFRAKHVSKLSSTFDSVSCPVCSGKTIQYVGREKSRQPVAEGRRKRMCRRSKIHARK